MPITNNAAKYVFISIGTGANKKIVGCWRTANLATTIGEVLLTCAVSGGNKESGPGEISRTLTLDMIHRIESVTTTEVTLDTMMSLIGQVFDLEWKNNLTAARTYSAKGWISAHSLNADATSQEVTGSVTIVISGALLDVVSVVTV